MTQQIINIGKSSVQYFLTLLFAAIGSYIGLRLSMNDMKNDIKHNEEEVVELKENIGNINIQYMYEQHLIHGKYISKLVPNQLSLAKDCKKTLLMNFEDVRGSKSKY